MSYALPQILESWKSYVPAEPEALTPLHSPATFLRTNSLISFPVELGSPITCSPANLPNENSDEAVLSYECGAFFVQRLLVPGPVSLCASSSGPKTGGDGVSGRRLQPVTQFSRNGHGANFQRLQSGSELWVPLSSCEDCRALWRN